MLSALERHHGGAATDFGPITHRNEKPFMAEIKIAAETRTEFGKGAARRLRRAAQGRQPRARPAGAEGDGTARARRAHGTGRHRADGPGADGLSPRLPSRTARERRRADRRESCPRPDRSR